MGKSSTRLDRTRGLENERQVISLHKRGDKISSKQRYKVSATYGITHEKHALVEAESPERAAVAAILRGLIPTSWSVGHPIFWRTIYMMKVVAVKRSVVNVGQTWCRRSGMMT